MGAWKTLRITKPCTLRIDRSNLVVEDEEFQVKLSLPDIDSIVFEGDRFLISAKVLAELGRHKVAVLFCDDKYMPISILHPYFQSALATKTLNFQLSISQEFKDLLWQRIVQSKIALQRIVLEILKKPSSALQRYEKNVQPADQYGMEAKAARIYWKQLFDNLVREPNSLDVRNQCLNYAYAIVRSLITRDLSAAGFVPALGIWHRNNFNAFNLSDDLIEPFRPLVDLGVYKILQRFKSEEYITPTMKRVIIEMMDKEFILFDNGLTSLRKASKLYIQSFKQSVTKQRVDELKFPAIDREKFHECF